MRVPRYDEQQVGVPSVPSVRVQGSTSAEAFGAGIGEALQRAGQKLAVVAAKQQEEADRGTFALMSAKANAYAEEIYATEQGNPDYEGMNDRFKKSWKEYKEKEIQALPDRLKPQASQMFDISGMSYDGKFKGLFIQKQNDHIKRQTDELVDTNLKSGDREGFALAVENAPDSVYSQERKGEILRKGAQYFSEIDADAFAGNWLQSNGMDSYDEGVALVEKKYGDNKELRETYLKAFDLRYGNEQKRYSFAMKEATVKVASALEGNASYKEVRNLINQYASEFQGSGFMGQDWAIDNKDRLDRHFGVGEYAPKPQEVRMPYSRETANTYLRKNIPGFATLTPEEQEKMVRGAIGISEEDHVVVRGSLSKARISDVIDDNTLGDAVSSGVISKNEATEIKKQAKTLDNSQKNYLKLTTDQVGKNLKAIGVVDSQLNNAQQSLYDYAISLNPADPKYRELIHQEAVRIQVDAIEASGVKLRGFFGGKTAAGEQLEVIREAKFKGKEYQRQPYYWERKTGAVPNAPTAKESPVETDLDDILGLDDSL